MIFANSLINQIKFNHIYLFQIVKRVIRFYILPVLLFFLLHFILKTVGLDLILLVKQTVYFLNISITKFILKLAGIGISDLQCIYNGGIAYGELLCFKKNIVGLRYFFIAPLIICVCVTKPKTIISATFITYFVIIVVSVIFMTWRSVNPETITDSNFSLLFEGSVIAILMVFPLWSMRIIHKSGETNISGNDGDDLSGGKNLTGKRLYYYVFTTLVLLLVYVFSRFSSNVHGMSNIDVFLSEIILYPAKALLEIFGYEPHVKIRDIKGDGAWIFIGIPCLGKRIMLVFTLFMIIFNGVFINKIILIALGLTVIIIMNIFRIAFLYVYLDKTGSIYLNGFNLHDLYNYLIYAAVITMWIIFIKFFKGKPEKHFNIM